MILTFLAKNYQVIAAAFLVMSFCLFLVHKGYDMRIEHEQAASLHNEKVKDEIRNRPHSASVVNSRWLRGTF